MKTYGFLATHGYEILKGYLKAESEDDAKAKIKDEDWEDIIDSYTTEECVVGYEVIEIWECE